MNGSDVRPVVAHYRAHYLARSETFIHETVSTHSRYAPVVVTHGRTGDETFTPPGPVIVEGPRGAPVFDMSAALRIRRRRMALRRALEAAGPDLVHAHFGEEGVVAAQVAMRLGVPSIVTFYGLDATRLAQQWLWRRRFHRLFRRAGFVLAEGPHMKGRLLRLGCPPARVRIQRIPIRLEIFPFRPRTPPDDGRFIVLQACRFFVKKGGDLTLRAFARVATEQPAADLWLLGDGPEKARLVDLVQALDLGSRVRFLGMRSHSEYAAVLAQAHIFIHPSRTARNGDGEGGAPTALLEAQACGMPIVASDHADIPFIVAPEGALLAPEGDVEAIAGNLRYLMRHPEEWTSRAEAGRSLVERRHDPGVLSARLEALYDEVIEAHRRA